MSRRDDQRLADILAAAAIADHITRGELDDGLVFDAVRVRLIEIGEAVKAIDPDLLAREQLSPGSTSPACATTSPTSFDTAHAIVRATLTEDLPPLVAAAKRLFGHLAADP